MNTFSIGEALRFGWRKTIKHFWFLAGLLVITMVVSSAASSIQKMLQVEDGFGVIILLIVSVVLHVILQLGTMRILLNIVDGKPFTYKDLLAETSLLFPFLVSSILVITMVSIGFVLLIIPAIIIGLIFQFYGYIMVDKNVGIIESLVASKALTKGHRWQLFGFSLAGVGVNILGFLALGIGLLWSTPTVMLGLAYIYRKLSVSGVTSIPVPTAVAPPALNGESPL